MANRYTQLTASEYRPVDLQTMMIAPSMMRQRHDQADAQREQLRSSFNMFGDVLPYHTEELQKYKDEFNNLVNTEADQLARYGVGKNTNSNLIKLNSQYQNLMNPQGRIGKMTSAKADYAEKRKAFIENAVKDQKFSLADAERNWNRHAQSYTGYDGTGGIDNIQSLGAPKREDLMKDIKDIKDITGEVQRVASKLGYSNARVRTDLGGALEVVNSKGEKIINHNLDNLMNGANMLMTKWLVPGNSGYLSAEFEGLSPQEITNQITTGIQAMTKHKVTDTRQQSSTFSGYDADNMNPESNIRTINTGTIEVPFNVSAKDINSAKIELDSLQARYNINPNSLTADERKLMKDYQTVVKEADNKLSSNKAYTEYMSKNKDRIKERGTKILNDNGIEGTFDPSKLKIKNINHLGGVTRMPEYNGKMIDQSTYEKLRKSSQLPNEIQKIQAEAYNNSLVETRELNSIYTDRKKSQGDIDLFKENVQTHVDYNYLLNNGAKILNIDGNRAKKSLEGYNEDLPKLMSQGKVSNVEFGYSNGANNEVVRITYKQDKDSNVKIDGVSLKDKDITVDVAMPGNKFSRLSGTSNASGIITDRFGNTSTKMAGNTIIGVDDRGKAITQRDFTNPVTFPTAPISNASANEAQFGDMKMIDAINTFTPSSIKSPTINKAVISTGEMLASELQNTGRGTEASNIRSIIQKINNAPDAKIRDNNIMALRMKLTNKENQALIGNLLGNQVKDLQ